MEKGFNNRVGQSFHSTNTNEKEIKEAKVKEFNSWKENNVYEKVEYRNQKLISTRWVLNENIKQQKNNISMNDSQTCRLHRIFDVRWKER